MNIIDLKQFIAINKLITYIIVDIKFYNQKNYKQVHKTFRIIKLQKQNFLLYLKIRKRFYFMSISILTKIN